MFRSTIAASVIAVGLFAAQAAEARTTLCERAYPVRQAVIAKHGKRAPGRQICRHGVKTKRGVRRATTHERAKYLRQLKQLNHVGVRAVPPRRRPGGAMTAQAAGWAIPREIVMCESRGDYNAVNGSSGARGAYQVTPGTHAEICPDLSWSQPDQDTCAARIWKVQGRSAWSC